MPFDEIGKIAEESHESGIWPSIACCARVTGRWRLGSNA
jgi:hypothetical protein